LSTTTDKHRVERIHHFFHWYRQRYANVVALTALCPPEVDGRKTSFVPEQYLMIGAHIDALAKHWAAAFKPSVKAYRHADRMQDFLQEHANSTGIFNKVCAPLLFDEAQRNHPRMVTELAQVIHMDVDVDRIDSVRTLEGDPDLSTLQRDPKLSDAGFQETVLKYRFGVVLYREIRNQWVHETVESRRVAHPEWDTVFRYQNMTRLEADGRRVKSHPIVLPVAKLLQLYNEALISFEHECVEQLINPSPQRGQS
jgi:hypothetical protein